MKCWVYLIFGPEGKAYAGISINPKARWGSHIRRSREPDRRHPLYDSMRKHGEAAFRMHIVKQYASLDEAKAVEVGLIKGMFLQDRRFGYNLSPGGDYDCLAGPRMFWDAMRADPEKYEAYRAKLCAAQGARGARGEINFAPLVAFNQAKDPKARYKQIRRASRVALRKRKPTQSGIRPRNGYGELVKQAWQNHPASYKLRWSRVTRAQVTAICAARSAEVRAEIGQKIAATLREVYAPGTEQRAQLLARSEKGRQVMDRKKQGAAASAGLKSWWSELKQDPERYAEFIKNRTESLLKRLAQK